MFGEREELWASNKSLVGHKVPDLGPVGVAMTSAAVGLVPALAPTCWATTVVAAKSSPARLGRARTRGSHGGVTSPWRCRGRRVPAKEVAFDARGVSCGNGEVSADVDGVGPTG